MHVVDIAVDLLHVVHLRHRCRRAVGVLPTLVLLCPRERVARSMITCDPIAAAACKGLYVCCL